MAVRSRLQRSPFAEAHGLGQLREFYHLLAMRQVLTVPHINGKTPSKFLLIIPKIICLLPLLVHGTVIIHDFQTAWIGHQMDEHHTRVSLIEESAFLICVLLLTIMVSIRWVRVDAIWAEYWGIIIKENPSETNQNAKESGPTNQPLLSPSGSPTQI